MKTLILSLLILLASFTFAQNNALNFDGTDDYVQTSEMSLADNDNLSLEAWIYIESLPSGNYDISSICGIENSNGSTLLIRLGDGISLAKNKLQFVISLIKPDNDRVQFTVNGSTELSTGKWYHIACTFARTSNIYYTRKLYLNGVLEGDETLDDATVTYNFNHSSGDFHIGAINGPGRYFNGKIDEVRVWKATRSEIEIRANMYKELAGSETGLFAYYKLNEASGTSAVDSKGSLNGTLTNMDDTDWITSPAFFGPKSCLDFDAASDYAGKTSPVMTNTDNFTMMVWFKKDDVTANLRTIAYNGKDGNGYGIGVHSGVLCGFFGGIGIYCKGSSKNRLFINLIFC